MEKVLSALTEQSKALSSSIFKSPIYHLRNPEEMKSLTSLLRGGGIFLFGEIVGQREELVKSWNSKIVYKGQELTKDFLKKEPKEQYEIYYCSSYRKKIFECCCGASDLLCKRL